MALHFLIDGYNVINKINDLFNQKLETQRNSFLELIERNNPQGARKNKVTVVFDGQMDVFGSRHEGDVNVIFSSGETADDRIKRFVRNADNKKNIIVVTDDREIIYAVRQEGAQICSSNDFISKIYSKKNHLKTVQKKKDQEDHKNISKALEDKVNKELEDLWLEGEQD